MLSDMWRFHLETKKWWGPWGLREGADESWLCLMLGVRRLCFNNLRCMARRYSLDIFVQRLDLVGGGDTFY